jgi:hypothetical protein
MRPVVFIIITISVFISVTTKAQGLEETFKYANSQFENHAYENALEVYRRTLFFDTQNQYGAFVFKNMADCLYKTEHYEEAAYYYDLAYFVHSGDEQNEITLQKASCHLLLSDYNKAKMELFNLPDNLSLEHRELSIFYDAMINFALGEFDASKSLFMQIARDTSVVNALFVKNAKIDKLKPKTAKVLSIILPGLGQFYAGDVKNGLNSFILSGGLFFLGVRSAINNSILDAALSIMPWYQRYYTGGYNKAYAIAESKIKECRFNVFQGLLDEIED